MSQPKVYNPHGDVFARWLNAQPRSGRRGINGSTCAVDSAPKDTAALAEHFIALPLRDLRTGWPACVIDAMASGATLGAMARALTVISRRLYGVSVDERTGRVLGDLESPGQTPAPAQRKPRGADTKGRRARRLTADEVNAVRWAVVDCEPQHSIADRLGIPESTVSRISTGKAYREVG